MTIATTHSRPTALYIAGILAVFGAYSLALGAFMMLAPGVFFDSLGSFGTRNDHFIFDAASFELPLGVLLLTAVTRTSWRTPALAFATLHWALHTVGHALDLDHGTGRAAGFAEFAGLALGTVWLAAACWLSTQTTTQRPPESNES